MSAVPLKKNVVTRPLSLKDKIDDAKKDAEYELKRIWACSWSLVPLGAAGVFYAINESLTSRNQAAFVREFAQKPWDNSNYTGWTVLNATRKFEDRFELEYVDIINNMFCAYAGACALVVMMAVTGLNTVRAAKSHVATKMFRRQFFTFLVFLIFFCYYRRMDKYLGNMIKDQEAGKFNQTLNVAAVAEPTKRLLVATEEPEIIDDSNMVEDEEEDDVEEVGHPNRPRHHRHGHHGHGGHGRHHRHHNRGEEEEPEQETAKPMFSEQDIYRIYAPRLWEHKQMKERHGRHPTVMADKDGKKHDDPPAMPPMEPFHPGQFYCTFAGIYLIFFLKFVEKSLAKLEFLKRAMKKLEEKRSQKVVDVETESVVSESTGVISNNNSMM